jgi:hypothetical protein
MKFFSKNSTSNNLKTTSGIAYTPTNKLLDTIYGAATSSKYLEPVIQFLDTPSSEILYNTMTTKLITNPENLSFGGISIYDHVASELRFQVLLADGTVAFDSYFTDVDSDGNTTVGTNTWTNFQSKTINENQATRSYVMGSLLSASGTFSLVKYSSTVKANQLYTAFRAGSSSSLPTGVVSLSATLKKL